MLRGMLHVYAVLQNEVDDFVDDGDHDDYDG